MGLLPWYQHNCTLDCPTVPSNGRTARVCLGAPNPHLHPVLVHPPPNCPRPLSLDQNQNRYRTCRPQAK